MPVYWIVILLRAGSISNPMTIALNKYQSVIIISCILHHYPIFLTTFSASKNLPVWQHTRLQILSISCNPQAHHISLPWANWAPSLFSGKVSSLLLLISKTAFQEPYHLSVPPLRLLFLKGVLLIYRPFCWSQRQSF